MSQEDIDIQDLLDIVDEPDEEVIDLVSEDEGPQVMSIGDGGAHDYYEQVLYLPTDEACETIVKIFAEQLQQRGNLAQFLLNEGGLNIIDWWEERAQRNFGPELDHIKKIERSLKNSLQHIQGAQIGSQRYDASASALVEGVKSLLQTFMAGNQHVAQQASAKAPREIVPSPSDQGKNQAVSAPTRVQPHRKGKIRPFVTAEGRRLGPVAAPEVSGRLLGAPFKSFGVPPGAYQERQESLKQFRETKDKFSAQSREIVNLVQNFLGEGGKAFWASSGQNPKIQAHIGELRTELKHFRKYFRRALPPSLQRQAVKQLQKTVNGMVSASQTQGVEIFPLIQQLQKAITKSGMMKGDPPPDSFYNTSDYDIEAMADESMQDLMQFLEVKTLHDGLGKKAERYVLEKLKKFRDRSPTGGSFFHASKKKEYAAFFGATHLTLEGAEDANQRTKPLLPLTIEKMLMFVGGGDRYKTNLRRGAYAEPMKIHDPTVESYKLFQANMQNAAWMIGSLNLEGPLSRLREALGLGPPPIIMGRLAPTHTDYTPLAKESPTAPLLAQPSLEKQPQPTVLPPRDPSDIQARLAAVQARSAASKARIGALTAYYTDEEGRKRLKPMAEEPLPAGTQVYGKPRTTLETRAQERAETILPLEALAEQAAGGGKEDGSKWAHRLHALFLRADFNPDWLQDLKNQEQFGRGYKSVPLPESIGKELISIMRDARLDFERVQGKSFNVEYTEPEQGKRTARYSKPNFSWKKSWVVLNNWFLPMLVEHGLLTLDYIETLRGRRVPGSNQAQAATEVRRRKRAAGRGPRPSGAVRVVSKQRAARPTQLVQQGSLYTSAMAGRKGIEGPHQLSSGYMVGSNPVQHMFEMSHEAGSSRMFHLLDWGIRKAMGGRHFDYGRQWIKPVENHPFQVQMETGASAFFPTLVAGRKGMRPKVDKDALGNQLAWIAIQDLYAFHAEQEAKGFKVPTGVSGPQWDGHYDQMHQAWAEGGRAYFGKYFRRNEQQQMHMRPFLYDHLSDWMVGKKKAMGFEMATRNVREESGSRKKTYLKNSIDNPLQFMYTQNTRLDDLYKKRVEDDEKNGHFGPEGKYLNDKEKNLMLRDFQWNELENVLSDYTPDLKASKNVQRRTEFEEAPVPVASMLHAPRRKKRSRSQRPAPISRTSSRRREESKEAEVAPTPRGGAARAPRLMVPSRSRSPTLEPAPAAGPAFAVARPAYQPQLDLGAMEPDAARPAYELAARNLEEVAVRADVMAAGYYGIGRQHYHLMHDLTGAQPVMGRAHIVRADIDATSKHWMHDVQGDINDGATKLMVKGRRGPFKDQRGASQVLDRSAHVMYRRRHRTMEITVKRGVSEAEMDLLMSKLLAQQVSAPGCMVVMVKGGKRYPMGPVSAARIKTLRALIHECLDRYATCGIHLIEGGRVGAISKKLANSTAFKVDVQRHRGLFSL